MSMTPGDYISRHNLDPEKVKEALTETGQKTHPTSHIKDIPALDKIFGVTTAEADAPTVEEQKPEPLTVEAATATPPEDDLSDVNIQAAIESARKFKEPEVPLTDPSVPKDADESKKEVAMNETPVDQRTPPKGILGKFEVAKNTEGKIVAQKKCYYMLAKGVRSPIPVGVYRAWAWDSSEAIAVIRKSLGVTTANGVSVAFDYIKAVDAEGLVA